MAYSREKLKEIIAEKKKKRAEEGLPISVRATRAEPTRAGTFVREELAGPVIRRFGPLAEFIKSPRKALEKPIDEVYKSRSNRYIGNYITEPGVQEMRSKVPSGMTPKEFYGKDLKKEILKATARDTKAMAGDAAQIGSNVPIFGGATTIAKNFSKIALKQLIKNITIGSVEAGLGGAFSMGGKALSEDKSAKEVLKESAKGFGIGSLFGLGVGTVLKSPTLFRESVALLKSMTPAERIAGKIKIPDVLNEFIEKAKGLSKEEFVAEFKNAEQKVQNLTVLRNTNPGDTKIANALERIQKEFNTISSTEKAIKDAGYDSVENFYDDVISQTPKQPKVLDSISQTPEGVELIQASQNVPPMGTLDPTPETTTAFETAKNRILEGFTSLRETFEDSLIRLKNLERTKGTALPADITPWERKQIMSARISSRLSELNERATKIISNVEDESKKLKIDAKETRKKINEYLIARHAPERNLKLNKSNAAGITDEQASEIIKRLQGDENFETIKKVADDIQSLNNEVLDLLHQDGNKIISDQTYKILRESYKNHVPLQRVMDDELQQQLGMSGRTLDVRSSGLYRAKGSEREVEDILENVVMNYERAIFTSEKNRFAQSVLEFAELNKDSGLFKVVSDNPSIDPTDAQNFGVFVDGKQKWVKVIDPVLGSALKGTNIQNLPGHLNFIETFTRIMSQLATRFNPEYLLSGFIRDTQEMLVSAGATKGITATGALAEIPSSQKSILKYLRGIDDADTQLYKQFLKDGGGGGMAASTTRDKIKIDLSLEKSMPKKAAEKIVKFFDSANSVFENANRFSVYKEALNRGLSRDKAALVAQESTINFSRKGTAGPIVNALYMFANASIQGSTKMLRAMKNPKVAFATVAAVGTAVEATSTWNDSVDEDWRSKISDTTRSQNLVVVLPGEDKDGGIRFIKIPVSWGIRPIKVTADALSDTAHGHGKPLGETLNTIASAVIDGYNPLGGSDIISAITPSIGDIPIDIARNQTFSGAPIKPDTYGKEVPKSEQYFRSLQDSVIGRGFIAGTQKLADIGIEISPADVEYAYRQLIGGTGRFTSKTVNAITAGVKGEELQSYDIPFGSRFYEKTDAERTQAIEAKKTPVTGALKEQERARAQQSREVKNIADEIQDLPTSAEKRKRLIEVIKEDEAMGKKIIDELEERSYNYSGEERKIKQLGVENGARAQYVVSQINTLKTNKEKREYLVRLTEKKVISDQVLEQVIFLLTQ